MKITTKLFEIELIDHTKIEVSALSGNISGLIRQITWYKQGESLDGGTPPAFTITQNNESKISLIGNPIEIIQALSQLGRINEEQRDNFLSQATALVLGDVLKIVSKPESRAEIEEAIQQQLRPLGAAAGAGPA